MLLEIIRSQGRICRGFKAKFWCIMPNTLKMLKSKALSREYHVNDHSRGLFSILLNVLEFKRY